MGRSPCCDKAHTNKGAWTQEEDQKLIDYIKAHGEGCWRSLPRAAGLLRCGKSCRLRWINYLRPDLKRGNFTDEEDELIVKLHVLLGNKWSLIASRLPGRTDNEIKNYWNSHIKKKLLGQGIDPRTHQPTASSAAPFSTIQPHKDSQMPLDMDNAAKCSATDDTDQTTSNNTSGHDDKEVTDDFNLDLDLSISLPHCSSRQPPPSKPLTMLSTTATQSISRYTRELCLCSHLGFESCETCSSS
ncbi:hypothetical protein Cni_G20619 [Canna indica]|uniref:Uncharacterized protein n=1 Tax=Canna indica TaxID=4628 RepID=A0AAQ3KPE7_9LILI|nr:hypothetical protein Cni_G20619 [Canna indica]